MGRMMIVGGEEAPTVVLPLIPLGTAFGNFVFGNI
jgi:hypothetical protein